jgi:preprotein translocase subunit SecA
MDFESAERYAKDQAERAAEGQIFDAIEENLPSGEEESEWNWEALAKLVNTRWKLNYRDRDLKKVGRENLAEMLMEQAVEAIEKVDLSEGKRFLEEDFGVATAAGWVQYKFGIAIDPQEIRGKEPVAVRELVRAKAVAAYDDKEAQYPVMAGLYHFTTRDASGQKRYDRDALISWARERFHVDLETNDVRNLQRDEVRRVLVEHSRAQQKQADSLVAEVRDRVDRMFEGREPDAIARHLNGELPKAVDWLSGKIRFDVPVENLERLNHDQLRQRLEMAVEDHYRPEIRRMERVLILEILDTAWKDHLLAMDHLRSSVGLRGYAQVDPKVEYKREGMRTFEAMWSSVQERVTDLVFKMEQLDENFISSTWQETAAIHDEIAPQSTIAAQQQEAIEGTEAEKKLEPIRNRDHRVGRNDLCPCGSGKKYKNCCMRNQRGVA